MIPLHHFDLLKFSTELVYTALIVILCFLIYYKTKEIDNLTKHKGIHYFRQAFLFFGLAYVARFLIFLTKLTFEFPFPRRTIFPICMVVVGYLSTISIFYLIYSTVWRKIHLKPFLFFSHGLAILLSALALLSGSPITFALVQLGLMIFVLIMGLKKDKKRKYFSQIKVLYILLFVFWLSSIFVLGLKRIFPFELKLIFQIVSLAVFGFISYKVIKRIK